MDIDWVVSTVSISTNSSRRNSFQRVVHRWSCVHLGLWIGWTTRTFGKWRTSISLQRKRTKIGRYPGSIRESLSGQFVLSYGCSCQFDELDFIAVKQFFSRRSLATANDLQLRSTFCCIFFSLNEDKFERIAVTWLISFVCVRSNGVNWRKTRNDNEKMELPNQGTEGVVSSLSLSGVSNDVSLIRTKSVWLNTCAHTHN